MRSAIRRAGAPPRRSAAGALCLQLVALLLAWPALAGDERRLQTDRDFSILRPPVGEEGHRAAIARAGELLGRRTFVLAGVPIDGARLIARSMRDPQLSIVRVLREDLRRPVDIGDFMLFLDDLLVATLSGRLSGEVHIPPARARHHGVLIHPEDVFDARDGRRYGDRGSLSVERPRPQRRYPAASDGDALGPEWTMRYPNPEGERALLDSLRAHRIGSDFADRIESLIEQLRAQGAEVHLGSTVRQPERGYLMWGAFVLSRIERAADVPAAVRELERVNHAWGLRIPIRWRHPRGDAATLEAARRMAETYDVVYATREGARSSSHYEGRAVDLTAVGLPSALELVSPEGVRGRFDLSYFAQSRDLSLSPRLIRWVESHFGLQKLRRDYPHWDDASSAADGLAAARAVRSGQP